MGWMMSERVRDGRMDGWRKEEDKNAPEERARICLE